MQEAKIQESFELIPIIDFQKFIDGENEAKVSVAKQILDAFQKSGFFYLKNHGINQKLVDEMYTQSKEFF